MDDANSPLIRTEYCAMVAMVVRLDVLYVPSSVAGTVTQRGLAHDSVGCTRYGEKRRQRASGASNVRCGFSRIEKGLDSNRQVSCGAVTFCWGATHVLVGGRHTRGPSDAVREQSTGHSCCL